MEEKNTRLKGAVKALWILEEELGEADRKRKGNSIQINERKELGIRKLGFFFFAKKPIDKSDCKETNRQWVIFL